MHASIGTVSTLCKPQNAVDRTDKSWQLAMETVDNSWTKQRVECLQIWCKSKASKCKKASMCSDALEKHLDLSHVLGCEDFLKIAFIVNNGLFLIDEEEVDGSCEAKTPNLHLSTESAVDIPACEFIQFTSECMQIAAAEPECESEQTMAEIEKQMNDLIAGD
jgi:hypothetical protein